MTLTIHYLGLESDQMNWLKEKTAEYGAKITNLGKQTTLTYHGNYGGVTTILALSTNLNHFEVSIT